MGWDAVTIMAVHGEKNKPLEGRRFTEIAEEQGLGLDHEAFEAAMRTQRERARASWVGSGETAAGSWQKLLGGLPETAFTGYTHAEGDSKVAAIFRGEERVKTAVAGDEIEVLLERTPFYAESGGQAGDRGEIRSEKGLLLVADTKKHWKGYILHRGRLAAGVLAEGEGVSAVVDVDRRRRIARNHTATHLLQAALRKALNGRPSLAALKTSGKRLTQQLRARGLRAKTLPSIFAQIIKITLLFPLHACP
jgi:alanyl-tRNA synthetase